MVLGGWAFVIKLGHEGVAVMKGMGLGTSFESKAVTFSQPCEDTTRRPLFVSQEACLHKTLYLRAL